MNENRLDRPSENDGHIGDDCRPDPDVGQHDGHLATVDLHRVHERLGDGVVAIDANAAQVQYRHGTKIDVERVPDVAHPVAK